MSKNYNPILVISGDPKSIFLEIFFKSFNLSKRPLILIVNKAILIKQIKLFGYKFKLNELSDQNINKIKLTSKTINFINVPIENKNNLQKYLKMFFNFIKNIKENQKFH